MSAIQANPQRNRIRRRSAEAIRQARQNRERGIDPHLSPETHENWDQDGESTGTRPNRQRLPQHRHKVVSQAVNTNAVEEGENEDQIEWVDVGHGILDADILTVANVAQLLRMSVDSVRRIDFSLLPHTGRIGAGRYVLYLRENVLDYVRQLTSDEIEARSSNMNSEATENQINRISDGVRRRSS